LIATKRDGSALTDEQIRSFIRGVTNGSIPDYQVAAMLMGVFFRGLNEDELSTWTDAMLHSGSVVDLSHVGGVKVDKHSTGGVGDKVSICLAPLVAACGVPVPMISGRGLGHTGGTLDKLEAIPGFRTDLGVARFKELVERIGIALIGQTDDLAPADRKLYALRDVTATVESIPLIASSIMSKKLAEGIDALVLDVKVGSGAFMKTIERAELLAQTLCGIGRRAGKKVTAFLTDMNQPLGQAIGNANETREAIEVLRGTGPEDLRQLTLALAAEMLVLGDAAPDPEQARGALQRALESGAALEKLGQCIEAQGGDPRVALDQLDLLPSAPRNRTVTIERDGVLAQIATDQLGLAAMTLGAGRKRVTDPVDPRVGILFHRHLGEVLRTGERLATLQYDSEDSADQAQQILRAACRIAEPDHLENTINPPLITTVLR
jgi:pyrimidine-nucleoside phosphorylase